jgi:hypothetical protein
MSAFVISCMARGVDFRRFVPRSLRLLVTGESDSITFGTLLDFYPDAV